MDLHILLDPVTEFFKFPIFLNYIFDHGGLIYLLKLYLKIKFGMEVN